MRLIVSIVVGALLGFIGSKILFVGSALSLIPWGLVGLVLGLFARSKKEALLNGAVYGFVLSFIFMVTGYTGSRPLIAVVPFFIFLGLFGALCGCILGFIGRVLKSMVKRG